MFGEIKKMLGIEDVKLALECPDKVSIKEGKISGEITFTSMNNALIQSVEIKIIEKYHRGRSTSKLIDEYIIGEISMDCDLDIKKQDVIKLPFELPFKIYQSEMDKIQKDNFLLGGLASIAKLAKGIKSEFRIEAIANVKGTKLHPQAIKSIKLT